MSVSGGEWLAIIIASVAALVSMLETVAVWILAYRKSHSEKFRVALKEQCDIEASESEITEYMP